MNTSCMERGLIYSNFLQWEQSLDVLKVSSVAVFRMREDREPGNLTQACLSMEVWITWSSEAPSNLRTLLRISLYPLNHNSLAFLAWVAAQHWWMMCANSPYICLDRVEYTLKICTPIYFMLLFQVCGCYQI